MVGRSRGTCSSVLAAVQRQTQNQETAGATSGGPGEGEEGAYGLDSCDHHLSGDSAAPEGAAIVEVVDAADVDVGSGSAKEADVVRAGAWAYQRPGACVVCCEWMMIEGRRDCRSGRLIGLERCKKGCWHVCSIERW